MIIDNRSIDCPDARPRRRASASPYKSCRNRILLLSYMSGSTPDQGWALALNADWLGSQNPGAREHPDSVTYLTILLLYLL